MKEFMCKDFLLSTKTAQKLYHEYASSCPIIDYHCHIDPREIAEDIRFENITQVWLGGDHYKWRLMRTMGVEEQYITGDAPDREKFQKWAETLELAIGNPLYHWSHAELKQYFGYDGILNSQTAQQVWDICVEKLKESNMSARGIIKQSNVDVICTTDDPADSLEWHKKIAEDTSFDVKVLPAWRPEKAMNITGSTYLDYLAELTSLTDIKVDSFKSFISALEIRLDYFHANGCKLSDHSAEFVIYQPCTADEIEVIFAKRLNGETLSSAEVMTFKTMFMLEMGRNYCKRDWSMQLHFSSGRDANKKMFNQVGSNTGFDYILNLAPAQQMADFLSDLASTDDLPKTILYSCNPNDNVIIDTIMTCFQDSSMVSKMQHGSAWWFNDHKDGMTTQMVSLASTGMLATFIGMLTDSRSFLSYARHEYFRRILCDLIGTWVENGEYPEDYVALEKIVKGISYYNAKNYFKF
ncbi:MAG: glucuronate isomerase [Clostridia bacterium]